MSGAVETLLHFPTALEVTLFFENYYMKKHFLILIFSFSFMLFKAQDKVFSFSNCVPKNLLTFRFNSVPLMNTYSGSTANIYIKTQLPKLPFFCNMEEKCRNRFNVFLKIRAGNDESYERMIRNK